jgi:hypothetical protein
MEWVLLTLAAAGGTGSYAAWRLRLGSTDELSTEIDTLATGRYSLACVRARVAGGRSRSCASRASSTRSTGRPRAR